MPAATSNALPFPALHTLAIPEILSQAGQLQKELAEILQKYARRRGIVQQVYMKPNIMLDKIMWQWGQDQTSVDLSTGPGDLIDHSDRLLRAHGRQAQFSVSIMIGQALYDSLPALKQAGCRLADLLYAKPPDKHYPVYQCLIQPTTANIKYYILSKDLWQDALQAIHARQYDRADLILQQVCAMRRAMDEQLEDSLCQAYQELVTRRPGDVLTRPL